MRVGSGCSDYYQSLPRQNRNGRPLSPPPQEVSKNYHQTMVYIPYNHIDGYQSPNPYYTVDCYARVTNQNQINKRFIEPVYQSQRMVNQPHDEHLYQTAPMMQKPRLPYPSNHILTSRSESPLPGQFSTARATQTPAPNMSSCNYYPNTVRYRPIIGPVGPNGMMWQGEYVSKINRHSFPAAGPR